MSGALKTPMWDSCGSPLSVSLEDCRTTGKWDILPRPLGPRKAKSFSHPVSFSFSTMLDFSADIIVRYRPEDVQIEVLTHRNAPSSRSAGRPYENPRAYCAIAHTGERTEEQISSENYISQLRRPTFLRTSNSLRRCVRKASAVSESTGRGRADHWSMSSST